MSAENALKTRKALIERNTKETRIKLYLDLDGRGEFNCSTGVGFFDHMLELLVKHAGFDIDMQVQGDLAVDAHHTVEDVAICLGRAMRESLGDKKGVCRYGYVLLPMDEALVLVALDLSGRGYLGLKAEFHSQRVGDFDTELVAEFLRAFAMNAEITLHVRVIDGKNAHHIIEAIFKGLARSLKMAVSYQNGGEVPSTKGIL